MNYFEPLFLMSGIILHYNNVQENNGYASVYFLEEDMAVWLLVMLDSVVYDHISM